MYSRQKILSKYSSLFLFIIILCVMSSCGSKKILYNPTEVAYLSKKLSIPINNDDPNIPLFAEVSLWLGTPYKYAGDSRNGADCSGFVYQVYDRVYGKKMERSSDNQAKKNTYKVKKSSLLPGDLVFFRTSQNSKKINHVGIFLKNGLFIHSSTSRGIVINSLNEEYYLKTWVRGGRVKF